MSSRPKWGEGNSTSSQLVKEGVNLNLRYAIGQLNQRFEVEIGLGKKLARAEREISAARERQPNFESELAFLREENAKQQKLITRLRGQASQHEYALKKLDAAQMKDRRETSLVVTQVTVFGERTASVLRSLCEETGLNLIDGEYGKPN
jgi:septal ring factor EnvC (AmiA/AmiB activator)